MVEAPPLETFEVKLHEALSNLVKLEMSLLTAEGSDKMVFKGHLQPNAFCDSMIERADGSFLCSLGLKDSKEHRLKAGLACLYFSCQRSWTGA